MSTSKLYGVIADNLLHFEIVARTHLAVEGVNTLTMRALGEDGIEYLYFGSPESARGVELAGMIDMRSNVMEKYMGTVDTHISNTFYWNYFRHTGTGNYRK